jgi:hypothetical protein
MKARFCQVGSRLPLHRQPEKTIRPPLCGAVFSERVTRAAKLPWAFFISSSFRSPEKLTFSAALLNEKAAIHEPVVHKLSTLRENIS